LQTGQDANKQIVPFRPPDKGSEPEARRAEDYISLLDELAKGQSPTVAQIYQESLAKYPNWPAGLMRMAIGSPTFLATPLSTKPAA
jgi:hypothetical protein